MAIHNYRRFKVSIDPDSKKLQGLRTGDVVRRQYRDGNDIVYSLLIVLETGKDILPDGRESAYFTGGLLDGDVPQSEEILDFVRTGHLFDSQRTGALYMTGSDACAPFLEVIDGVGTERSLCLPYLGNGDSGIYDKNRYSFEGELCLNGEYRGSDGDVNRVFRLTCYGEPGTGGVFVGLKQFLGTGLAYPERVVISYKVRASKSLTGVPVELGYADGREADGLTAISAGVEWSYELQVITLDHPASHDRAFGIDLTGLLVAGEWFEIAELNIIRLSDVGDFTSAGKTRVGKMTGISDPVFGDLKGYGSYLQRMYATGDVSVAGTLTAADKGGFGSTFYAGKIYKNCCVNSLSCNFGETAELTGDVVSPVGIGHVRRFIEMPDGRHELVCTAPGWSLRYGGELFTFSIWIRSASDCRVELRQNEIQLPDIAVRGDGEWNRYAVSFPLSGTADATVVCFTCAEPLLVCAPQLERGESQSQYQPTDEISDEENEDYGAWMSRGGVGGTIQNPLLRFDKDGSIASRDGSFRLMPDGSAFFRGTVVIGDDGESNVATKADLGNLDLSNYAGEWDADREYHKGVIVSHGTKAWVALQTVPAGTEPNPAAVVLATQEGVQYVCLTSGRIVTTGSDTEGGSEYWGLLSDNTVNTSYVARNNNSLAQYLGYSDYENLTGEYGSGKTVIKNGILNTDLIEATAIIAKGLVPEGLITQAITAGNVILEKLFRDSLSGLSSDTTQRLMAQLETMAHSLGYSSYNGDEADSLTSSVSEKGTIIAGGMINTSLIVTDQLLVGLKNLGVVTGLNADGTPVTVDGIIERALADAERGTQIQISEALSPVQGSIQDLSEDALALSKQIGNTQRLLGFTAKEVEDLATKGTTIINGGKLVNSFIDTAWLQSQVVKADYIEGLTFNFEQGRFGGWVAGADFLSSNIVPGTDHITLSTTGGIQAMVKGEIAWLLGQDGSGVLANGLIQWSENGSAKVGGWSIERDSLCSAPDSPDRIVLSVREGVQSIADDMVAWELLPDGSGKLAQGNVSWLSDGTGQIAGGAIRWTKDRVLFGGNVQLGWDNLSAETQENLKGQDGKAGDIIFIRGTGSMNAAPPQVLVNDIDVLDSYGTGLTLVVLSRKTLQKIVVETFDTTTDSGRSRLATRMGGFGAEYFVILVSCFGSGFDASLVGVLTDYGSSGYFEQVSTTSAPFAFIGYKGLKRGAALEIQCLPMANGPHAEIACNVISGVWSGLSESAALQRTTHISNEGIYTGSIDAVQIKSGKLDARYIHTESIVSLGSVSSGSFNLGNGTFSVTNGGYLSATAGQIAIWKFDDTALYNGPANENTAGRFTGATDRIVIGNTGIRGYKWRFEADGSGSIGGGAFWWDKLGNAYMTGQLKLAWENFTPEAQANLKGKDANLLPWVEEWNGTLISHNCIQTAKLFAGRIENGVVNGVTIGNFNFENRWSVDGIIGFRNNEKVFILNGSLSKIGGWNFDNYSLYSEGYDSTRIDASGTANSTGKFVSHGIRMSAEGSILSSYFVLSPDGAFFRGIMDGASGKFGNLIINGNGLSTEDNSLTLNKTDGLIISKGSIGGFSLSDYELRTTNMRAGITIGDPQGSCIKVGNSYQGFFTTARLGVSEPNGNYGGIFVDVLDSKDEWGMFDNYNYALNVVGATQIGGRNIKEHTYIRGSSNTPQLLCAFGFLFDRTNGVRKDNSRIWWDTGYYFAFPPVSRLQRLREGVYKVSHSIIRKPAVESEFNFYLHVTSYQVRIAPIDAAPRYGSVMEYGDDYFIFQTADDSSPNDSSYIYVEIYNNSFVAEFAKRVDV